MPIYEELYNYTNYTFVTQTSVHLYILIIYPNGLQKNANLVMEMLSFNLITVYLNNQEISPDPIQEWKTNLNVLCMIMIFTI